MIIRIHKDWHSPDLFRQLPNSSNVWKDAIFTEGNTIKSDFIVVLNRAPHPLFCRVPEGNRILMIQEPPIDSYNWQKKSIRYFDKVLGYWESDEEDKIENINTALPWHIGKNYDELKKLKAGNKEKLLSTVTSLSNTKSGHQLRLDFINHLKVVNIKFDHFGRGIRPVNDKFDALYPYKYSLALENHSCNDYWTEKFSDCLLSWRIPIYYGATNISQYFPKGSYLSIDIEKPEKSISFIKEVIHSNYWEENIENIKEARSLILDKYQFFPMIYDYCRKQKMGSKKKLFLIPSNHKYGIAKRIIRKIRNTYV